MNTLITSHIFPYVCVRVCVCMCIVYVMYSVQCTYNLHINISIKERCVPKMFAGYQANDRSGHHVLVQSTWNGIMLIFLCGCLLVFSTKCGFNSASHSMIVWQATLALHGNKNIQRNDTSHIYAWYFPYIFEWLSQFIASGSSPSAPPSRL